MPYQPIPSVYQDLIDKLQQVTPNVQYNAVLVRLYFDGSDQITGHTDGRTFIGEQPTIASLSWEHLEHLSCARDQTCGHALVPQTEALISASPPSRLSATAVTSSS